MAQPRVYLRQKWTRYLGELRPIHDIYVDVIELPSPTPTMTPTVTPTVTPTITPTQTTTPSPTPFVCMSGYGFNDRVDVTEIDILNGNRIYVGGLFTDYNGVTRENITRIYTNGTIDYTWNSGTGLNAGRQIYDIHQLSSGKVIIGGNFLTYNGFSSQRIARLNSDGSYDSTFYTTNVITGDTSNPVISVLTIGEQSNGKLIVGGNFGVSGQSYTQLCRLNSDGSLDTTFVPPTFTGSGSVQKVIINPDDTIYVGTSDNGISGQSRRNIFLLTSGGTYNSATSFNSSGVGTETSVFDMELTQVNKLMVVGSFLTYNGSNASRAVLLNSNGTKDSTFNNTGGFNQLIYDFVEDSNGKYMFCGFFNTYSGTSVSGVIRTFNTGVLDTTFSAGTFIPGTTEAKIDLTIDGGGSIYVGGEFISYDGYDMRRFVKLYPNGQINDCDLVPVSPTPSVTPTKTPTVTPTNTVTPSITPTQTQTPSSTPYICFTGSGFNDRVDISEVDTLNSNKLYVAGRFTTYNGITRENITRIFLNGDIDYTWDSDTGFGASQQTYDIHQLSSGKIYVGGDFTSYRGNSVGRIVRINSGGTYDNTFVQGTGFNGIVKTIQQQSDGKLIVGGAFTSYSGISCTKIARLNTDGSFDSTFTVNALTGTGNVEKIVVNPDDTIYIGGNIGVSGQTRRNLILLTSGGSYDSGASFNTSGVGPNLEVNDFEITQTNKLIVVGGFTQYNGATNNRIIRLNSDGTKDTSFTTTGFNQLAYDVTEQTDGKYLVCGYFTTYSGISSSGVVRINSGGTRDSSFTVGTFTPDSTEAKVHVTVDNSGSIYIGGEFTAYSGYSISNFVKLYTNGQINDCDLVPVSPTPSVTPTRTPTLTPTNTGTISVTQTPSPSVSPTQTITPSVTPTQTITPSITSSPTPSVTSTLTPTQTITQTQTNTPSNTATPGVSPSATPTITPSQTPPCAATITVDNNGTNIDITAVSVNLYPVTYVSGDNFTIGPSEFGTFETTITGGPTLYIDYTTSTSSTKNINVIDCASPQGVFCLEINSSGSGTWVLEGAEINCGCTLTIVVTDGACL